MTDPFLHNCHCGQWGSFGYTRTTVEAAQWYCREHRPDWTANNEYARAPRSTPARFIAQCALGDHELDTRTPGVYQWTSGWVMQRAGGGGHAITLPKRANSWACRTCVERAVKGHGERSLFDPPES